MYRLYYYGLTRPGRTHTKNEDSFLIFIPRRPSLLQQKGALFVVADGAGGHAAGEVASRLAVETIRDVYYFNPKTGLEALLEAFLKANERIRREALHREAVLATTATALVCREEKAFFAQVGNSRLYLLHDQELFLLTEDDTLVEKLRRRGLLTSEEARRHPQRHILTQALGVKATPHLGEISLKPGSVFLLTTDGVHEVLDEKKIQEILLRGLPPQPTVQELVREVEKRGAPDDFTIICVKISS